MISSEAKPGWLERVVPASACGPDETRRARIISLSSGALIALSLGMLLAPRGASPAILVNVFTAAILLLSAVVLLLLYTARNWRYAGYLLCLHLADESVWCSPSQLRC